MSLTIKPSHAYALISGLYIGKFTNLFSDIVITGLVLYIVTPEIFTEDRLTRAKNYFWSWFRPREVKIDITQLTDSQKNMLTFRPNKSTFTLPPLPPIPRIEIVKNEK